MLSRVNHAGVGKVKERTTPRYRQVSQSDAGQMSDGCFLVVFLINEALLGKIRTTKRHGLEKRPGKWRHEMVINESDGRPLP